VTAARVAIVVLAAGGSTRMGEPKQLLDYGGEPLVRRAAREALASGCRPCVVVLGAAGDAARDALEGLDLHVAVNDDWAEGMGGSIRAGIAAVDELTAGEADAAIVALCDQPFVSSSLLARLVERYSAGGVRAVATGFAGTYGPPALFDHSLFDELRGLGGSAGARQVLRRHEPELAIVVAPEAGVDVDRPADYRALERRNRPR
jgi:molybdenum cofactor cytidylyltransferase